MLKHKSKRVSYKPVYFIFALSLVLSIGFVSLRSYLAPQKIDILAIDPSIKLIPGGTTVTGIIQKDSSINQKGNFLLVLRDMRVIILDISKIENLIGRTVTVQGILLPPESGKPGYMTVKKITIIK